MSGAMGGMHDVDLVLRLCLILELADVGAK
jgi:hypothetical protein